MTAAIAQHFTRAAAWGLARQAQKRQADLQNAFNDAIRAFRALHECGASAAYIEDELNGLCDEVNRLDHILRADLDNCSVHAEHVDTREADELLERVRALRLRNSSFDF